MEIDKKPIDWSANPELTREIVAVGLIIIGALFMLSIFNLAGKVGLFLVSIFDMTFGFVGYLLPFVVIASGIVLWNPEKYKVKPISLVGIGLCFIFIPALIAPNGGIVGNNVSILFHNLIGVIASYIMFIGLSALSILLAMNMSFKELMNKFNPTNIVAEDQEVKVHGAETTQKVSVFEAVKSKIGINENLAKPVVPTKPVMGAIKKDANWEFPPLNILGYSSTKATSGNIAKNVETVQKTLRDFGIEVAMGDVNIGPTVTQYTLKPKEGIKLNQITARSNDLALALAAHPIRIEAPIPGKAAVGIEIPNKVSAIVTLREMLETKDFKTASNQSNLSIALGRDVAGTPVVIDLKKMPHLLVAGATGTGKSICLHSILLNLLYQNSPSNLRLILVDPKRVEFTNYSEIPHLLSPAVTEVDKTIGVLKWAISEMDRRFKLFAETRRRDIASYNQNPTEGKLPYLVIVIDELADLMAQASSEVEGAIVRLAQMARATGIHLIVATQRPSVDVITGLIKANITSRIAFAVASQFDSRTIIDQSGAEKLLGKGDMLYMGSDFSKPRRVQGAMVQEKEIREVTEFLKKEAPVNYDESLLNFQVTRKGIPGMGGSGEFDDDLYEEAKEIVAQAGKASASLLQRRLRVGYARAARLLDLLEENGIIGPAEGAKPRDVLIDPESVTGSTIPDNSIPRDGY